MEHSLDDSWTLYLHYKDLGEFYNDNLEKLQDIYTIENFWRTINNIPKTYELFSNGIQVKKIKRTNAIPCAYSFFRKNIKPCWEDPMNCNGFEFSIKSGKNFEKFEKDWINSLITLVSNVKYNMLTGIRVVDLTKGNSVLYRMEFWSNSEENKNLVQNLLLEDFNITLKMTYRSHKDMKEN
jgi:hypothetical protein